ncbi:MAG: PAS domain-containing protein, partial [Planctomycetota bacterium]
MQQDYSLAEGEPDFKSLVEGITDVIWSAEIDGTIRYLSPQFKTIFGLEPADWIGRAPFELVHPDDVEPLWESIKRQNGNQQRVSLEFRHLCHDGSYLWVGVNAIPIFDDKGNMVCRQGTARDISVRKRMEKDQARLTEILQSTSDFVGICQTDVGILWQNKPFRNLRPDLDIVGQNVSISELYPEWAYEIVKQEGMPTAIAQGTWSGETALLDSSGREVPTSQVIIAHKSDTGAVEYFSTILRDISQIKAADQALKNAQSELLATTKNVPGVIYRTVLRPDGSHGFSYISPSIRGMAGMEPEVLFNDVSEFWALVHPDDVEEVRRKMHRSAKTGEPYHASYRLRHAEKGMRWAESWALPSWLENGDIAFDGILIDVTDRKVAEQSQREAQAKLQTTSENVPGVIYRTLVHADGTHSFAYVSPSFRSIFGLEPEAPVKDAREFWTRIHPDDVANIKRKLQRSVETGEPYHATYRLRHDEKGMRWFGSWSIPSHLENGDIAFDGILIDIHDRKVTELAQKDAQAQYRSMTDNVPGVMYRAIIHPDGSQKLTFINESVRDVLGLDPQALVADVNEVWKRIHPDDKEEVERKMLKSMKTLQPKHSSFRLVVEEKGTRWIESWSLPTRMDNGDTVFDGIMI